MADVFTVECRVDFGRRAPKAFPQLAEASACGKLPRVTRLMALAIRFQSLIRSGVVESYGDLADLGHVTRARVSQIMNLTCLAPDIQEQLLFLPLNEKGRDRITLADLQPITLQIDWAKQRREWQRLRPAP